MNGCPVERHTFRFMGRVKRDWSEGEGPRSGWLMWASEDHEPHNGIIRHWYTVDPEKFWRVSLR